ncbi:MAG: DNA mismatch repair endonuclease MutL [Spirochaetaceae bacterium]|jgi:DNA mismatch repair protein MutL|nr:DNA mismatch repair endonuclease MutL [Spirochaetaceae bacterium]
MMDTLTKSRIQILPPEEARKIAAGEVVNRPAALVREFIDNALDAGSTLIELVIDEGGIRRTEVIDNGGGMTREDLELCWYTHATSKIRSLEDLNTAETLGFRGEALAAAAAVARLEILTSTGGREAWQLEVGPGNTTPPRITQTRRAKGTNVRALGLFDTIPARKRFLKREGSEANLCRQAFIDKALAFYGISFRFIQDGKLKLFLPAVNSRKERFAQALLTGTEGLFLYEITLGGTGFSVAVVAGGPELYRNDRRQQYVFANGRRIQDFSLLQALEYGLQGWFPNGTHPIGGIYVSIDPALADFNIHPAKQEARFVDAGAIHHAVTQGLRDFSRHRNMAGTEKFSDGENKLWDGFAEGKETVYQDQEGKNEAAGSSQAAALALEALLENPRSFAPLPGRNPREGDPEPPLFAGESTPPYGDLGVDGGSAPRLAGRVFDLFLLVEWKDRLFIIDQHAAHERLLFNRFMAEAIPKQELLVPLSFTTESEEDDRFLSHRREDLAKLGIIITEGEEGLWYIEALPANWRLGDAETVKEILKLKTAGEDMAERWAATLSCHGAIKDGDYLDDTTALALAKAALKFPEPRCPHGRPIWTELSREELFRAVRRL